MMPVYYLSGHPAPHCRSRHITALYYLLINQVSHCFRRIVDVGLANTRAALAICLLALILLSEHTVMINVIIWCEEMEIIGLAIERLMSLSHYLPPFTKRGPHLKSSCLFNCYIVYLLVRVLFTARPKFFYDEHDIAQNSVVFVLWCGLGSVVPGLRCLLLLFNLHLV